MRRRGLVLSALALLTTAACAVAAAVPPRSRPAQLPAAHVGATPEPSAGRRVALAAGDDLQAALDAARAGDVITLPAGAVFVGPFTLPRKQGAGWITVRTSAPDEALPPPGARVDLSHAPLMPTLVAASGAVITAAPGAHHFRLVGLEIRPRPGSFLFNLVDLGSGARTPEALPHDIVVDRCYVHGDAARGGRRGIALNGRALAVVGSYLADFKEAGADSQAIAGWNGPGPFRIVNSYLEAAGENVMFGGADPLIPGLVPSDIEIRGNHLAKPPAWRVSEGGAGGAPWTVKNLLELKNARRVLVEGNVLEHSWGAAQGGFAVVLTVRNQDGTAPWSVVEDVTLAGNLVRHVAAGVNVLGRDDQHPSQGARRITLRHNVFEDVNGPRWGGGGTLLQMIDGAADVVVEHNTALHTGSIVMAEGPRPHPGFVFRRNIVAHNAYGIVGTGSAPGLATLERYFPGARVEGNLIAGGPAARHPPGNAFPASLAQIGFVDLARGDYRLAAGSRYREREGPDPGADAAALRAARAVARTAAAR